MNPSLPRRAAATSRTWRKSQRPSSSFSSSSSCSLQLLLLGAVSVTLRFVCEDELEVWRERGVQDTKGGCRCRTRTYRSEHVAGSVDTIIICVSSFFIMFFCLLPKCLYSITLFTMMNLIFLVMTDTIRQNSSYFDSKLSIILIKNIPRLHLLRCKNVNLITS